MKILPSKIKDSSLIADSYFSEHHYTMFNPEIDFAKVFETHTPLKIEYQDA